MIFKENTTTENIKKTAISKRYSFTISAVTIIIFLSIIGGLNFKILLFSGIFSFISMVLNEANNNDREHLIAIIQMITIISLVFLSVFYGEISKATLDSVNLITPMFGFYGLYGFYLKSKENNTER